MTHCNEMIYQQVTLSGYAEWPKVADAVIEAAAPHPLRRSVYHENRGNVAFSMASLLKRRAFNQHLVERIVRHFLEKSSPDYEELCHYGIITETAA
jgi:hypothetical protein